jgi:subtilisin family serine protease
MKKNNFTLAALAAVVLSFTILFGFKIQPPAFTDFYYYQGKPFHLIPKYDAIFIKLNDNVSQARFENLISDFPALNTGQGFNVKDKKDFIILNEMKSYDEMKVLIDLLKQREEISFTSVAFSPDGGKTLIGSEDEIIVQFKLYKAEYEINNFIIEKNLAIMQELNLQGGKSFILKVQKTDDPVDMANKVYESGMVNWSEPNLFFTNLICYTPNDQYYSSQWAIRNTGNNIPGGVTGTAGCDMRVDSAWDITLGHSSVKIAISDTGCDTLHADIAANFVPGTGYNFYNNTPGGFDDEGHGTCCAGIVAAVGNNGIGISGIAPNCKLIPVKWMNSGGSGNYTGATNATIYSYQQGAWIISNSWGFVGGASSALDQAIADTKDLGRNGKGTLFVVASGNENGTMRYPASTNPNVLVVGGISPCNQRKSPSSCDNETWWGASYGSNLDIVAPCVKIYATDITGSGGYSSGNYISDFNGTSSATPNAAGVAALILSVDSSLTWDTVRVRIGVTADRVGSYTYNQAGPRNIGQWNNEMGYGRINAYDVVKLTRDLMGPIITHTPLPNTEQVSGNYVVNCTIAASGSPLNLSELKLLWSKDNPSITDSVVLTNTGGDNFTGNIPSAGTGLYRYYIKAKDNLNRTTVSPVGAPVNLYSFIAFTDVTPPEIIHTPIQNTIVTRWPVEVSAAVTDEIGVQSVVCEFRINGGGINTFTMSLQSGSLYNGTFTGFVNVNDVVEYRIKATDNSLQNNIGYNPSSGYHSFTIIASLGTVLVIDDDVTLQGRISNDKISSGIYSAPLGASADLFNTVLTAAGYTVDQVTFSALNTSSLSDYDAVILSAGVKESAMFNNAAKRTALVNYTLAGGKTLVEGGEVGYIYRVSEDIDPSFRRNLLLDSVWVNDRIGANLQIAVANHSIFNTPNVISSPITIDNGGENGWGARDEMTLLGITGISRIANWVGGTAANGGILIYNPGGDTSVCRNVFFSFAVSQIANQTTAASLIENAVHYLLRDLAVQQKTLNITAVLEGLWNGTTMVSDEITVELRNTSSPYSLVEQNTITLNSSGSGTTLFTSVSDGTPYYIIVKHRNGLETWSSAGQQFTSGILNYNFTSAQNKAYGNNLVLKGGKWCIYSGDVNQDGFINATDLNLIFTDNLNGVEGYTSTDLNGDEFTEIEDINIVFINSVFGVERKRP